MYICCNTETLMYIKYIYTNGFLCAKIKYKYIKKGISQIIKKKLINKRRELVFQRSEIIYR